MSNSKMYELAMKAVAEHFNVKKDDAIQPDVLWAGGILDDKRAVVWYGKKLVVVKYDTINDKTTIEVYTKAEE